MQRTPSSALAAAAGLAVLASTTLGAINDFNNWTLVEDPPSPNFSSQVVNSSQIELSASGGAIPAGTDIGYQSVDGVTPATSTQGYAFDPAQSFSIAVDFSISFPGSASGDLGIGFGIGEDSDGMNSAGVALLTRNGTATAFGGAARINDVTQAPQAIVTLPSLTGAFFVSYDEPTGDVTVGVGAPGAGAASASTTFAGIQNSWNDGLLLASFFLRSDGTLGTPWASGTARASFTDFRVLSGSPVEVPSSGSSALAAIAGVMVFRRRR